MMQQTAGKCVLRRPRSTSVHCVSAYMTFFLSFSFETTHMRSQAHMRLLTSLHEPPVCSGKPNEAWPSMGMRSFPCTLALRISS